MKDSLSIIWYARKAQWDTVISLSFRETKVLNYSLRPKSETLVSDFGLKLNFKTLITAKDEVTQCIFSEGANVQVLAPVEFAC